MKKSISVILCVVLAATAFARKQPVPHMYMFGFAASFTDTIVHFTPIQELDNVWIESKTRFLQERDAYTFQLRNYLEQQEQMPHRTCVVFYNEKRNKLEKEYQKMLRLYGKPKNGAEHFDLRHLTDFRFTVIDMNEYTTEDDSEETDAGAGPTVP